jgi:hypothetical protein
MSAMFLSTLAHQIYITYILDHSGPDRVCTGSSDQAYGPVTAGFIFGKSCIYHCASKQLRRGELSIAL